MSKLPQSKNQKFRKGLADSGGWREETLPMPGIEASFLHPFSFAPLRRMGTHFLRTFWLYCGGCWSPAPSRQPLFRTSEEFQCWFRFLTFAGILGDFLQPSKRPFLRVGFRVWRAFLRVGFRVRRPRDSCKWVLSSQGEDLNASDPPRKYVAELPQCPRCSHMMLVVNSSPCLLLVEAKDSHVLSLAGSSASSKHIRICTAPFEEVKITENTVVAEMITELIRSGPEISTCNGNKFKFKTDSVSVMRDFC